MKKITKTVFVTFDGKEFDSEEDAKAYEKENEYDRFCKEVYGVSEYDLQCDLVNSLDEDFSMKAVAYSFLQWKLKLRS